VKFDLDEKQIDTIKRGVDYLEERTHHYYKVVTTDTPSSAARAAVGTLAWSKREHRRGRADGARRALRAMSAWTPLRRTTCSRSTWCRDSRRSGSALRSALERVWLSPHPRDRGSTAARRFDRAHAQDQEGETISRVEAPRGEAFYFIKSNGGEKPERVKVRTPSLCNFTSVLVSAPGHQLADMPMILAGMTRAFRAMIVNE
jgi:NADH-quinone oxidoreductase subunit D